METLLVAVTAPHFCAGLIMSGGRCVLAAPILRRAVGKDRWGWRRRPPRSCRAPILRWAVGKDRAALSAYFRHRGWRAVVVRPGDELKEED